MFSNTSIFRILSYGLASCLIVTIIIVFCTAINIALGADDLESAYDYFTGLICTLSVFVAFVILGSLDVHAQDDSKKIKRIRNLANHKEYEALDKLLEIERN